MATDRDIFAEAARLSAAGEPFVLVTVIATKGSSPRDAGAKMIWTPAGVGGGTGEFVGTVGGGQFEMLVAESAARVFASRGAAMEHYVLGAEAEQCCGGAMDVFLEYCGSRQRLVIFGAGHVAHELTDVLRGSPLEMVVVDDRAEWNSAARFDGRARRVMDWDEGMQLARERADETLALVMTCSHETDFALLRGLLKSGAGGTEDAEPSSMARPTIPAFVGLIGSRSKRVCLFGRLISTGIDEEVVKRVQCPIGVGDTGKEPRMVAVSMGAGVLLEARGMEERRMVTRRGPAALAADRHGPVARAITNHGRDARATESA
jgi:xanthine dehydrogenase accessory factor